MLTLSYGNRDFGTFCVSCFFIIYKVLVNFMFVFYFTIYFTITNLIFFPDRALHFNFLPTLFAVFVSQNLRPTLKRFCCDLNPRAFSYFSVRAEALLCCFCSLSSYSRGRPGSQNQSVCVGFVCPQELDCPGLLWRVIAFKILLRFRVSL